MIGHHQYYITIVCIIIIQLILCNTLTTNASLSVLKSKFQPQGGMSEMTTLQTNGGSSWETCLGNNVVYQSYNEFQLGLPPRCRSCEESLAANRSDKATIDALSYGCTTVADCQQVSLLWNVDGGCEAAVLTPAVPLVNQIYNHYAIQFPHNSTQQILYNQRCGYNSGWSSCRSVSGITCEHSRCTLTYHSSGTPPGSGGSGTLPPEDEESSGGFIEFPE